MLPWQLLMWFGIYIYIREYGSTLYVGMAFPSVLHHTEEAIILSNQNQMHQHPFQSKTFENILNHPESPAYLQL